MELVKPKLLQFLRGMIAEMVKALKDVKGGDDKDTIVKVPMGVPQGSPLNETLFNIYMN